MEAKKEWPIKWKWIMLISTVIISIFVGFPTIWLVKNQSTWYAIAGFIVFFATYIPWLRYLKRKAEASIES